MQACSCLWGVGAAAVTCYTTPRASQDERSKARGSRLRHSPSHQLFQFLLFRTSPSLQGLGGVGTRLRTPWNMEPFLRKRLAFLSFFWNKIWPAGAQDHSIPCFPDRGAAPELEPPASVLGSPPAPGQFFRALCDFTARYTDELSVSRGDRLYALKEEGDYIFARRLSGQPSVGLVPLAYVAKTTAEMLADQPWVPPALGVRKQWLRLGGHLGVLDRCEVTHALCSGLLQALLHSSEHRAWDTDSSDGLAGGAGRRVCLLLAGHIGTLSGWLAALLLSYRDSVLEAASRRLSFCRLAK